MKQRVYDTEVNDIDELNEWMNEWICLFADDCSNYSTVYNK